MNASAILTVVLATAPASDGAEADRAPAGALDGGAEPTARGGIDEAVFRRWKALGIQPAQVCTDPVFVRRAYLDVIGTLPTPAEARQFLMDKDPQKRRALIDRLLEREEFADYWAMKWGDLLRVKAEFPINLWPNAAKAYHRWIRSCIKENMPYDRFVRELLTAGGSNFRVPPVNFYRAVQSRRPEALAKAAALTFMGARADKWEKDRLMGMARFFSRVGYKCTQEWKEEIVFFDSIGASGEGASGPSWAAAFPDGTAVRLPPDRDPREVFADWLITAKNPWFARNIVNRIWYWLLGRGIIHEPDDARPDNPAQNPELLALLERELTASRYDLKHIYRLILNSTTYQLSCIPRTRGPDAEAHFAHYPIRRLDAEVLIDALCQITASTEQYSSMIPEPFTFIPQRCRSIALPDGSITSSFLEMFGRPPRDTGVESERSNSPTAAQCLHLLNSSHVRQKIETSGRLRALAGVARRNPQRAVTELYLAILSRFPTPEELRIAGSYARSGKVAAAQVLVDLAWALINSAEFLYRH